MKVEGNGIEEEDFKTRPDSENRTTKRLIEDREDEIVWKVKKTKKIGSTGNYIEESKAETTIEWEREREHKERMENGREFKEDRNKIKKDKWYKKIKKGENWQQRDQW